MITDFTIIYLVHCNFSSNQFPPKVGPVIVRKRSAVNTIIYVCVVYFITLYQLERLCSIE
jgi:hypothetical protein